MACYLHNEPIGGHRGHNIYIYIYIYIYFFPGAKHKSQGNQRVELAGNLSEVANAEPSYTTAKLNP